MKLRYKSIAALAMFVLSIGCGMSPAIGGRTLHQKCGWEAEAYFSDPQVIALCKAIEADDLTEMRRLIAAGADVNALGKGNMTPLLWAFPDDKIERFALLLEHGANPNVLVTSDFNTRRVIMPGTSVTHLASESSFSHFAKVFEHGGDPNLVRKTAVLGSGDTPLIIVTKANHVDKERRMQLLIDKGADLRGEEGNKAVRYAVIARQFDLALELLEAGVDPGLYQPHENHKLIHQIAMTSNGASAGNWTPQQKADFEALVQWLEARGESLAAAQQDLARWHSWSTHNGEYRRKMQAEIAARKAREQADRTPDAPAATGDAKQ